MYHYVEDKEFLHRIKSLSGKIMQDLCHNLKRNYDIGSNFYLVGSGGKNLILQNESLPVDLDYNLEIVRCKDYNDCCYIKECVRKAFNKALNKYGLGDCEDSTSSLTSKQIYFNKGNQTKFSIDICIVALDSNDNLFRLIHRKNGNIFNDYYYWNQAPNSNKIRKKVAYIKSNGKWELVRNQYKDIKNRYLCWNDNNHPSYICYIEAVNNVYNAINM